MNPIWESGASAPHDLESSALASLSGEMRTAVGGMDRFCSGLKPPVPEKVFGAEASDSRFFGIECFSLVAWSRLL